MATPAEAKAALAKEMAKKPSPKPTSVTQKRDPAPAGVTQKNWNNSRKVPASVQKLFDKYKNAD